MGKDLEEGTQLNLDFGKIEAIAAAAGGVIPAVAQDIETGLVLMLGYVNVLALLTAFKKRVAVFWSTSRSELWIKGGSSGDLLELVETRVNCEQNSILYLVRPKGQGACHTLREDGRSRASCYYRVIDINKGELKHAPYRAFWSEKSGEEG